MDPACAADLTEAGWQRSTTIHTPSPCQAAPAPGNPCQMGANKQHRSSQAPLDLKRTYQKFPMSKAQLIAFFAKVDADPALRLQVDAATDGSAVVAIAHTEGFLFSAASLSRHQRG